MEKMTCEQQNYNFFCFLEGLLYRRHSGASLLLLIKFIDHHYWQQGSEQQILRILFHHRKEKLQLAKTRQNKNSTAGEIRNWAQN